MGDYRRLVVWAEARALTKGIYELTERFPATEQFVLTQQLRRSANSIGANIAEGIGRPTPRDTAHFLGIAIGSTNEVEQHLLVACDVGLATPESTHGLMVQVTNIRRMLVALRARFLSRGEQRT